MGRVSVERRGPAVVGMRRTASALALCTACALVLSGCFLRSLIGYVDEGGGVSLGGNVEVSSCNFDTSIDVFIGCTYFIFDDEGFIFETTSTFELVTEFGVFGIVIDPLVLQVPASATGVVATYNNAGSDEPLVVTETTSFPAALGVMVQAEPGTKFLILELPDAVVAALPAAGDDFDFDLDFDVGDPGPVFVKTMLTARVDVGGTRYYVPVFPCVTDFADIPAAQIPFGFEPQDLRPALSGLIGNAEALACDEVVYDFRTQQPVPTTVSPTTAPPTTAPPTTAPPTTVAVTSTTSVAAAAVTTTVAPTTTRPAVLPATGSSTGSGLAWAIALLLGGAAAVTVAARNRAVR